jgi:hypothetical protein
MASIIRIRMARWGFCACLSLAALAASAAQAEQKDGSGPTQAQIDCNNRAVNDYYDQLKECDKALGDLPADNAMCQSDAKDDLRRRQAGCTAAAARGGATVGPQAVGGAVLDKGQSSPPPSRGPMILQRGGTIQLFQQK